MVSGLMVLQIDARRLLCPMPVIRLQDGIAQLQPGEIAEITCTDPGVKNDIPAWCKINGHQIESIEDHDYEIIVTVRKAQDS
jgi:tRNA 2-thiouridine synthesizing protein A